MKYKLGALTLILGITACENMGTADTDIIRYAERNNIVLFCSTNEPFMAMEFNNRRNADGMILISYPGVDQVQQEELTRIAGDTPNTEDTFFRLSNNMEGTITRTPNGACINDMSGEPNNYKITVTRWSDGNPNEAPKTGCCNLMR